MAQARSAWSVATPMLIFSCFCLLVGDLLFGYDTLSFGGILANPGFVNQFGTYRPQTDTWAFDATRVALMSSLAFIGKFIGCFVAGTLIEKYGHRIVFVLLSVISVIGVVIEITAADSAVGTGRFAQFIVGRIVVYVSVGLVEVAVTTYQSEIVPPILRGFVITSLQLFLTLGAVIATSVNHAFSTTTNSVGWKTVTGIQFIFPVLICFFSLFIPNSPRWLLSKDREDDALRSLRRLRTKTDRAEGRCELEILAIKDALQENVHKAPWGDLFRGSNLRRTMIVMAYYFFQQTTGQAFVSTYQTVFYKEHGYASKAFLYPIITTVLGFFGVIPLMVMVDKLGRRGTLLISFGFQCLWLYVLAGVGQKATKSPTESNTIVAAFMLFAVFYNMGGASIPYLLGTEIPNAAVREKTQSLGAAWNVIWAFVTNYVMPYLISNLQFGVGWVFGSLSLAAFLFTFFFLPETKGRALEEIDAVFSVPFNPFRPAKVLPTEAECRIAELKTDKGILMPTATEKP